jgi:hypothetical protein
VPPISRRGHGSGENACLSIEDAIIKLKALHAYKPILPFIAICELVVGDLPVPKSPPDQREILETSMEDCGVGPRPTSKCVTTGAPNKYELLTEAARFGWDTFFDRAGYAEDAELPFGDAVDRGWTPLA